MFSDSDGFTPLMKGIRTTMYIHTRASVTSAAPCEPKKSVITPSKGGMTAPPHTPTISKADTSFVISGFFCIEIEKIIENKFA